MALVTFCVIGIYNMIINRKNKVNDKWEEIEIQLNKKAIVFSKFIEIVKSKLNDDGLCREAINNKNRLLNTIIINEKIKTNNKVDNILKEMRDICDVKFKNDESYNSIINKLNDINDKLIYSKEFYNKAVIKYNNMLMKIPFNIFAKIFKFKKYLEYEQ